MEAPMKIIIIVALVVVVLVTLILFFFQSSGQSLTKAEAERVFNTKCLAYSQRSCAWDATYDADFPQFLQACRVLYGQEREAFSCLYTYCKSCFETSDIKCSGLCNICSGHESASVDRNTCCLRYAGECSASAYQCGACS